MYSHSVFQWNPFVGCKFDCIYCKRSFQAQAKRQKHRCTKCYNYEPHEHPERLTQRLPKTGYGQFIFTCASGDIFFCSTKYLEKIVDRIRKEPDKTFLIQSKNPKTFERIDWPDNVILGTTIETNRESDISKAIAPICRITHLGEINHQSKMITIEPIMDFDLRPMVDFVGYVKPCIIWVGFDSKNNHLPEPSMDKVRELVWKLQTAGFIIMLKKIKE